MSLIARALPGELRDFAEYARGVAADSTGPHRQVWQERAEWAESCAAAAEGAVSLLATIGQFANTNDVLDDDVMVRVPLRLVRAARAAGGGSGA